VQLLANTLAGGLRQRKIRDALLEHLHVGGAIILGYAQLLLDDLELLAQEELALVFRHLLVDLAGDLALQLGHFALLAQKGQHFFHARTQRKGVEDLLQLFTRGGSERRGEIR
jgi:hypothetical protein